MISVVMPLYNCAPYVVAAVKSILNQTLAPVELVVVDDGSTDGGPELVERLRDSRIVVLRSHRGGVLAARMRGIDAASHDIIALMDSDDISHPRRLELQLRLLQAPSTSLVGCQYGILTPNGRTLVPRHRFDQAARTRDDFTSNRGLWCDGGAMFRRTDARRVGFRAPELKLHDPDVLELWYRLLQIGECRVIGEPLYYYRVRLGSLTHGARGRTAREYHDAVRAFYDPDGWSRLPSRPMLDDNNARSRVVSRAWEYYAWAGDFDAAREAAWKGLRSQPVNLRYWNLLLKAACRRATWRAPNGQNLTAKFRVPVNDELPQSLQIPQPA